MILFKFLLPTIVLLAIVLMLYWFSKDLKAFSKSYRKLIRLVVVTILVGLAMTFTLAYTFNLQVL